MKVSILTLHEANNIGAFLQAFSLQVVVESVVGNGNCSFIRFSKHVSNSDSKIKKAVSYLKKLQVRKVLFKYKTSRKYEVAAKYLNIDEKAFSVNNEYDTVIVGSDEVWNCLSPSFVHYEQYFARNIKSNKTISYAPSAGGCDADKAIWSDMVFAGFDHLSVRDENTAEIVRRLDGRDPPVVCDPTLLIESFEPYVMHIDKPCRKNYIMVYSYGLGRDEIAEIKEYAKANRKKTISVGTYNSWCDENIIVDPFEFLEWLKCADMVITSTFHGTVLSVKLHKQLAVYAGDNYKVEFFLRQMGLGNRNVSGGNRLGSVMEKKIDYNSVEEKIVKLRRTSMDYLIGALEN